VTVPDGVSCGQTIAVLAPDGSRLVKATIPAGLSSGDTFLVRLAVPIRMEILNSQPVAPPTTEKRSQPQFAKSLDTWTTPIDQPVPGTPPPAIIIEKPVRDPTQPSFVDALDRWLTPVPDAKAMNDNNSIKENSETSQERDAPPPAHIASSESQMDTTKPFGKAILIQDELSTSPMASDRVPTEPSATEQSPVQPESKVQQVSGLPVHAQIEPAQTKPLETEPKNTNVTTVYNQKLLLVQIPPGLPAGATMQVEIPGENRTLAAIVPPGAESFHIAYTPRPFESSYAATPTFGPSPPLQAQSTLVPTRKSRAHSPKGQKLLLVRVPLGTAAGTTLHVSVPDEPGRILAAQVPPGNVQEFHVSYEARPKQHTFGHTNGMLPPASPYSSTLQPQQQYYHQQPNHPSMMQPGYYHPHASPHNNGSNYWWPAAAGMVGGGPLANYGVEQQQYRDDENDNNNQRDDYNGGKDYELTDM
jgi:hypothetical protein